MTATPMFVNAGPSFADALDGPVWDGSGVLFCNVRRSEIHRWDSATDETSLVRGVTLRTRALAIGPRGQLFGAQCRARRVMLFDTDGAAYYLEAMLDGERHNEPQDLVVDSEDRIWFTDRATEDLVPGPVGYPPLDHSSVLRLTPVDHDGATAWSLDRMTHDTTSVGGISLTPDQRTLIVVDGIDDEGGSVLKSYAIEDDGSIGAATSVHTFRAGTQVGGICADRSGAIYVAIAGANEAGSIEVIDPAGGVAKSYPVSGGPTNCCFGDVDMRALFVTTASGQLLRAVLDN